MTFTPVPFLSRRKMVWFLLSLLSFFLMTEAIAQETNAYKILLCKNEKINKPEDHFSSSDKIYIYFTFCPTEKETEIEFRWINPFNKKEQNYFHWLNRPKMGEEYTAFSWLILETSFFDKIIGSRFSGQWRVEIWLNNKKVAERAFIIRD